MKVIFTRSNNLASRIIRKVTKEPVSHCALVIDGIVLHSNFLGVHPQYLESFISGSTEIVVDLDIPDDYRKCLKLVCSGWGKKYDFGALFYLLARSFLPFLPKKNLWQCSGMYLCTEWVESYFEEKNAMITPYQLYLRLGGKLVYPNA